MPAFNKKWVSEKTMSSAIAFLGAFIAILGVVRAAAPIDVASWYKHNLTFENIDGVRSRRSRNPPDALIALFVRKFVCLF